MARCWYPFAKPSPPLSSLLTPGPSLRRATAFIIYEFVRIGTQWTALRSFISYPMIVLGGAALVLRAVLVAWVVRLYRGFGSGLAEVLHPQRAPKDGARTERTTLLG